MPRPLVAISGLFVIGLGVAFLYPLSLALAVNAAGRLSDAASARSVMAVGVAILTMPAILGTIADRVGLHTASLVLPLLMAGSLVVPEALHPIRRSAVIQHRASNGFGCKGFLLKTRNKSI